jgi:HEAT repeat protein
MDEASNAGWLMDIALDESENVEVRKQALFMAGQRDDVDASDLIGVYDRAPDRELKQQALFVLSQSDDPAAFDKMLEVARDEDDPELRRNAIFWIGQSDDPRAEDVLLEILE